MTKGEKIVAGVALAAGVGGLIYWFTRPKLDTSKTGGDLAKGGASGGLNPTIGTRLPDGSIYGGEV